MKSSIVYALNFLYTCILAFLFPICFGWIYLDITGHAKGYSYDLGPEKEVSILLGAVELVVWLALSLPSVIFIFRKTAAKGKKFLLLPVLLWVILAILCILLIGGFAAYGKEVFNIS